MNAVFEPSLLFISDADWYDEEKQDAFLAHLLDHLDMIDTFDAAKIWWTDELQEVLVGSPNMHPWFQSDQRNPLIVTIHRAFYNRLEYTLAYDEICEINPNLNVTYTNQDAQEQFLKLVHNLIDGKENFHFCVGVQNALIPPNSYTFSCNCHEKNLIPNLLNNANDWLSYIDVSRFFPKTIEVFDTQFEKGMDLVKKKLFPEKRYLFDFEFTKNFKKSIIGRTRFQEDIFIAVVRKLTSTSLEAANSDLHDEQIGKKNLNKWRIRVTQRPSSTRIQYVVTEEGRIRFLQYYGEGEHDDGL
jgi:hypothetical protein